MQPNYLSPSELAQRLEVILSKSRSSLSNSDVSCLLQVIKLLYELENTKEKHEIRLTLERLVLIFRRIFANEKAIESMQNFYEWIDKQF